MTITDWINWLSVAALAGSLIALGYLVAVLYRANRIMAKIDHVSSSFATLVEQLLPAILNIGNVTNAVHGLLHAVTEEWKKRGAKGKK